MIRCVPAGSPAGFPEEGYSKHPEHLVWIPIALVKAVVPGGLGLRKRACSRHLFSELTGYETRADEKPGLSKASTSPATPTMS